VTAALYLRVSTDDQVQGYSIDAQLDRLRAYCKSRDLRIVGEYIDPGYSGSSLDRPAIQRLMKDAKGIDVVVVYKLDRLSRSQRDTLYLIEDVFLKNNAQFISVTESFDTTTPFGRAMVGILSVFAQLERENIRERMMSGKLQKARSGKHSMQGFLPIGYKRGEGKLEIDEYEAAQIREVFRMYAEGHGSSLIAAHMVESGYKHKYGKWLDSRVLHVVKNPVYAGMINYGTNVSTGDHTPIITVEEYEAAQRAAKKKPIGINKSNGNRTLFAGMIFCAECGCRFASITPTGGPVRYQCANARTRTAKYRRDEVKKFGPCRNRSISEIDLILSVGESLVAIVDENFIHPQKSKVESIDTSAIQKRIDQIDSQISRLLDLYELGNISFESIGQRVEKLNAEKAGLSATVSTMARTPIDREEAATLASAWCDMDKAQMRDYMVRFVDKITILKNHETLTVNVFMDE